MRSGSVVISFYLFSQCLRRYRKESSSTSTRMVYIALAVCDIQLIWGRVHNNFLTICGPLVTLSTAIPCSKLQFDVLNVCIVIALQNTTMTIFLAKFLKYLFTLILFVLRSLFIYIFCIFFRAFNDIIHGVSFATKYLYLFICIANS